MTITKHLRCPSPYIFFWKSSSLRRYVPWTIYPWTMCPQVIFRVVREGTVQYLRGLISGIDRLRDKESQKKPTGMDINLFFSSPEMESLEGSNFVPYDPSQEPLFPPELTLSPHLDSQDLVFRWKEYFFTVVKMIFNKELGAITISNRFKTWTDVGDKTFKDLSFAGGNELRGIGRSACPNCWFWWRSIQEQRYFHPIIVFVIENATF